MTEFLDVEGYDGIYVISSDGFVYKQMRKGDESRYRQMSLVDNGSGYLQVGLSKNNNRKRFYIHRIVWFSFMGEIPPDMEIDHINSDKTDNRLINLQLMTRRENMSKCLRENPHCVMNLKQFNIE